MAGRELLIVGAGGHGRVCAEIAQLAGFRVVGFCDSGMNAGTEINGIPVVAATLDEASADAKLASASAFVAIGDNDRRMELLDKALGRGLECPSLIHPSAAVSPSCVIGAGSVLVAQSAVNANARLGRGCIVNTGCTVDHDNVLEDGVQLCPGVHAAGNVTFGAKAFVGTGASVIPGIRIGAGAVVAAGAVVIADVGPGEQVAGVPARPLSG